MAFSVVTWSYRDVITSAKLAQMVENLRAHDHRADGTQGAPIAKGLVAVATGTVTLSNGGTAPATATINFPAGRFTKAPEISLVPTVGASSTTTSNVHVSSRSTTSFGVGLNRSTSTDVTFLWIAVQSTETA